jgi:hypothetical protein
MFERQLTRLLKSAVRHSAAGEAWPWAFIGVAAYLLRRALREPDEVERVKVRRGHEVTIAVHDQDR